MSWKLADFLGRLQRWSGWFLVTLNCVEVLVGYAMVVLAQLVSIFGMAISIMEFPKKGHARKHFIYFTIDVELSTQKQVA